MNRHKKIIKNIVIVIVLFYIFINRTGLYLSYVSAHEHSERSAVYGSSKIVHTEDFDKGKYLLSQYDKWISCNTVNKKYLFFWTFGDSVYGFENDISKKVDFSYNLSSGYYKCYGIRNDPHVKKVKIVLYNGDVYETEDFYEDLFLITWFSQDDNVQYIETIKAYDSTDNVILEENVH